MHFLLPSCKGARSCANVHGRVSTPLFASDVSEFSQRFIFRFSASCVRQGGGNASSHRYSSLLPQRSRFSGRLGVVPAPFVPVPVTCVRRLPNKKPPCGLVPSGSFRHVTLPIRCRFSQSRRGMSLFPPWHSLAANPILLRRPSLARTPAGTSSDPAAPPFLVFEGLVLKTA